MDNECVNPALTPTLGGQIVRIYLENFMAYSAMEIRPGSHLNMIIGPNGTGKSTVVCAVLLGLGGKLKTLSRADQLSSYVKAGCDQSLIEIELYHPGNENINIRRMITKSNNSQFFIDGKQVPTTKIHELRAKFNIQVDNLCTFLPQEKVQDFAKMDQQQLLEHTEKTIGTGELLEMHMSLKKLRNDLSTFSHDKKIQELQLQSEIAKNERIASKVEAIQKKQSLCNRVNLLNQKKGWLLYSKIIQEKTIIENDLKAAQKVTESKQQEEKSVQEELEDIENNSKSHDETLTRAKRDEAGKRAVVEDRLERVQQRLDKFSDLENIMGAKIADEEKKKKELQGYEATVDKLSTDLSSLDKTNETELKEKDQQLSLQLKRRHDEETELSRKKADHEEDLRRWHQELRNAEAEKRLLENRRSLRLEYLKRNEPDVYKSVQWLEGNQQRFRGKVYNPMLLELNVKNEDMARVVEATIPYQDLLAFTVVYSEDLNTLVQQLRVNMKLRINIVSAEEGAQTQYQPNIALSQIRHYGFHSYVKDFILGPEPILQYLCRNYKIHNIPVGDSSVQSMTEKIPNVLRKYFSDEHVFDVRASSYSSSRATSVKKLGDARFFKASVDDSKIEILNKRGKEIGKQLEENKTIVEKIDESQQQIKHAIVDLRQKRREIAMRLEEREKLLSEIKRIQSAAERTKKSIRDPKAIHQEHEGERRSLESAIDRMLLDLQKAHQALEAAYIKRSRATIFFKSSRIGIHKVKERLEEIRTRILASLDSCRMVQDRLRNTETECSRARSAARELTDGFGPGDRGFKPFQLQFNSLSDSLTDIETELEETQARADFLDGGSAQLLTEYKNRQEEINRLQNDALESSSKMDDKLLLINERREEWLQPIYNLISKIDKSFGYHFESMGCAGEVCLQIPEDQNDYDGYGIKIRVKFRDGIPLQDLSRNFQSGGERAVSTAIYMIALQNLTSVPFRFVDEINQGMDAANERRITDLIIRITSPRESSQYFFITPKLMQDFDCPDTMAVHCVYNGPFALSVSEWNIDKYLKKAQGLEYDSDDSAL